MSDTYIVRYFYADTINAGRKQSGTVLLAPRNLSWNYCFNSFPIDFYWGNFYTSVRAKIFYIKCLFNVMPNCICHFCLDVCGLYASGLCNSCNIYGKKYNYLIKVSRAIEAEYLGIKYCSLIKSGDDKRKYRLYAGNIRECSC